MELLVCAVETDDFCWWEGGIRSWRSLCFFHEQAHGCIDARTATDGFWSAERLRVGSAFGASRSVVIWMVVDLQRREFLLGDCFSLSFRCSPACAKKKVVVDIGSAGFVKVGACG